MEIMRSEALISIYKEQGSPELLPFEPQLFTGTARTPVPVPLLENKALLQKLPVGNHLFRARAFGWEDSTITVLVEETIIARADIYMKPATFKLDNFSQNRRQFNPLNPGSLGIIEYRFEVTAPGIGTMKIYNSNGILVYTRQLDQFDTWVQRETWDGKDSRGNLVPQGIYTVIIEASALQEFTQGDTETSSLKLETRINYSKNIFPQSLESMTAGLTFTPLPHVLPAGSYQFSAGILIGAFGMPFNLGIRVSPFERFEFTSALNINPHIDSQTGWGISGSVKYNIIDPDSLPFAFSAGLSYSWASHNGEHPISPGHGVAFHAPLSLELANLSFVICPSLFWRGPAELVPELLLCAGVLYQGSFFTGALSIRYEHDFKEDTNPRLLAGAEIYFYPAPSNFIFILHGGIIYKEQHITGYAGLGIGVIF
jgi:hypothetical protein